MKTLDALAEDLERGRSTSRSLVEDCLSRIADPAGEGSRTFLKVDAEAVRAAADYMDALRKRGAHPSRFAGIPISAKDLFDLAGDVTTAGSVVLKDASPATADAPSMARLKAKGFVIVGRTNMTEFAYSGVGLNPHYGTPRSPFDRQTGRIPGGSSSGAAVSTADGMCAIGIGTDTGGSCRIPASYCGVVGYKPSVGRIPTTGVYPLSSTLDSIGSLARSVRCAAIADAAMAGDWDGRVGERAAGTLRLGALTTSVLSDLEPIVSRTFQSAIARLSKAGAVVRDVAIPGIDRIPAINASGGISAIEAFAHHRKQITERGDHYDPRVRKRIVSGSTIPAVDYVDILRQRAELVLAAKQTMAGVDALVMPTTPNVPPAISALAEDQDYARLNFLSLRNTVIGNFLNFCSASLPIHGKGEAPVGMMLMAPWGCDQALLGVAAAVEAALSN